MENKLQFTEEPSVPKFEWILDFPDQSKFKVLYVLAGFSNVGGFVFEFDDMWGGEEEGLKKELESLGLFVNVSYFKDHVLVDYSKSKHALNKHLQNEWGSPVRYHILNAYFYGIPLTALQSYLEGTGICQNQLPNIITQHSFYKLIHFKMSKSHFREEWVDYVKKANQVVQKYPDLIKKLQIDI